MRISRGHRHKEKFEGYERRYAGNDLSVRWATFSCIEPGCLYTGTMEEYPQIDYKVIWRKPVSPKG